MIRNFAEMHCGLIGEKLSHSFSPQIHAELAGYSYELIELSHDEVGAFVRNNTLDAYNVTIPYKKTVMPFLDVISPEAEAIGAVNTVVREKDGKLHGHNTDYFGFCHMIEASKITVRGKKVLVLGRGGASATVCAVLRDMGVGELIILASADNTPENIARHSDAQIVVNTSPVGMYPNNLKSPVDLSFFKSCEGVLDLIYNPSKTQLLLDAEANNIPNINGLPMLAAQAVRAFELFTHTKASKSECERITLEIERQTKNIILIGMPGCGKTSVGKQLAKMLDRPFYDTDAVFTQNFEATPAEVILNEDEEKFRCMEHEVIKKLGKLSGAVISCGGGVVTRDCNYQPLHQNGTIIFLERELGKLSTDGRPLSQSLSVSTLYASRIDAYRRFADIAVKSTEVIMNTAELMLDRLGLKKENNS